MTLLKEFIPSLFLYQRLNIEGIYPGVIIASVPKNDLFIRLKFLLPFIVAKQDNYKLLEEKEALDILEEIITNPDRSIEEVHRFKSTHTVNSKNYSLFNRYTETYKPAQLYSAIHISLCDTLITNILITRIEASALHAEKALANPDQIEILNNVKAKKYKFNFSRNKFSEQDLDPENFQKWKEEWFQICKDFTTQKVQTGE